MELITLLPNYHFKSAEFLMIVLLSFLIYVMLIVCLPLTLLWPNWPVVYQCYWSCQRTGFSFLRVSLLIFCFSLHWVYLLHCSFLLWPHICVFVCISSYGVNILLLCCVTAFLYMQRYALGALHFFYKNLTNFDILCLNFHSVINTF